MPHPLHSPSDRSAATAAVGAIDAQQYATRGAGRTLPVSSTAQRRVREYLQLRGAEVRATTRVVDGAVTVACDAQAPITFGSLVGRPTIPRSAVATARPSL